MFEDSESYAILGGGLCSHLEVAKHLEVEFIFTLKTVENDGCVHRNTCW
jgi:hypothetical protein